MKVYILIKDATRCFSNGTVLHFNDQFIHICTDLETAKRSIDRRMACATNFREDGVFYDVDFDDAKYVYAREYVNYCDNGDSVIFRVIEKEIDDVPEVKENKDLKKEIEDLKKEIKDLKNKVSNGDKPAYREEPIKEKEAKKSNVKFW